VVDFLFMIELFSL